MVVKTQKFSFHNNRGKMEQGGLKILLKELHQQSHRNFEIFVNLSTDNTIDVLKKEEVRK